MIEEVGDDVHEMRPEDFVIVSFTHGCGKCPICLAGYEGNCPNATGSMNGGYQGEYYRAIYADAALVKIPGQPGDYSDAQLASFTTLADVMPTGYHAAFTANVKAGDTVVVFGDGAVGLCAVIACKLLGAKRIIAMSRHEDRAALAREFGATDVVAERGDEAVAKILELTDGIPHDVDYNKWIDPVIFRKNIHLAGGVASVVKHDKEILLDAVLTGKIDPGKVFTKTFRLEEIQQAYEAMDKRTAIKSLLKISE